jgi:hypothetical protein
MCTLRHAAQPQDVVRDGTLSRVHGEHSCIQSARGSADTQGWLDRNNLYESL